MELRNQIMFLNRDIDALEIRRRIRESRKASLDRKKDRVEIRNLQTEIEASGDNIGQLEDRRKDLETQIVMLG